MIRVGVFGAAGKVGRTVCEAVESDAELHLVGRVDPFNSDCAASPDGIAADVWVDFTVLEAARKNVAWCAASGVHAVVGTTGFTPVDLAQFGSVFTKSNCLIAPNFAIGALLMMRFAEMAAPWFDTAEVIELHHDTKADAPSGTAMKTVERMAAASPDWAPDPTRTESLPGARGAVHDSGIHVHSIRMRGMVAHQEVILGSAGQTLTIRHDSYDRTSFLPGVLLGCKRIAEFPGLTVGLDPLLGL